MLPLSTIPSCLLSILDGVKTVFTAPTFSTFTSLITGLLGATDSRTVTGMWSAAGLAGRSHHGRAHRFFSHARWNLDALGLLLARLVVDRFLGAEAALTVVVDDTLFHRYGKTVHGVFWQHDGSAKGRDGIGRGNCFVIVGLVVAVPFMTRAICLPVLFRLHIPKSGVSKPDAARTMVGILARAFPDRQSDVAADAAYRGPAWRVLPGNTTVTTRLASNAVLYALPPEPAGKRGHPAWKGHRLGTCAQVAATAAWTRTIVTCYGDAVDVDLAVVSCLWWGSLRRIPTRLILVRRVESTTPYDVAVITTDQAATPEAIIARYADRWSIEQTIKDTKNLLGAGDAHNRVQKAVERTVPFAMLGLTILTLWYHQAGSAGTDVAARRKIAPWYRHKRRISVQDMLTTFRRTQIKCVFAGQTPPDLNITDLINNEPTAA